MALYASQNSAGAERRKKATKRMQVAHAVLAALGSGGHKGGVAGGKPTVEARAGSAAAALPATSSVKAGGGGELDADQQKRLQYRREVLKRNGFDPDTPVFGPNANPEARKLFEGGSGIGKSLGVPTHDAMLAKLARQRAEAGGRESQLEGGALALSGLATGRRRRRRGPTVATGGGSG